MGSYDYAGCLSAPRVLHATPSGRLLQAPAPELARLRRPGGWRAHGILLDPSAEVALQGVAGLAMDIELTVERWVGRCGVVWCGVGWGGVAGGEGGWVGGWVGRVPSV